MEDLKIIEHDVANKPMIIKYQYTNKLNTWYDYLGAIIFSFFAVGGLLILGRVDTRNNISANTKKSKLSYCAYTNKFQRYHYLIQIIWFLFSLVLGMSFIFARVAEDSINKENGEFYYYRNKITIGGICFIIALIYTGYVMYKMDKYDQIEDHVEISEEYSIRNEGLWFFSSMILALIVLAVVVLLDYKLWKVSWFKEYEKNDDGTYQTDIEADIWTGVFLAIPLAVYIGMQYIAMKPMDRYYAHYLSSKNK